MAKRGIDEVYEEHNGMPVKREPATPPKKTCLNAALKAMKRESESPDVITTIRPPEAIQTPMAREPSPASSRPTPSVWKALSQKRLSFNLSSPEPPRKKQKGASLEAGTASLPPPPPAVDTTAGTASGRPVETPTSSCERPNLSPELPGSLEESQPQLQYQGRTTERKRVQNAFDMQRKHLDKDPAFKRYYEDLVALHGRSDPEADKFKKHISVTRNGRFDTPELLAIRKNIKVREWGKMSSWAPGKRSWTSTGRPSPMQHYDKAPWHTCHTPYFWKGTG